MKNAKKIIITEFGSWHDECLYSLCMLLKQNSYYIILIANESLRKKNGQNLASVTDEIIYYPFGSTLKGFIALWKFYLYLLRSNIVNLHINTAQGSTAWKFFMLPLPKRIMISGTLHYVKKLETSFGQRFITNRINSYLLLSDLLLPHYKKASLKPAIALYPIFYPDHPKTDLRKPENEIWITVPGAISYTRRDYGILIPPAGQKYPKHIKFILLGNLHKGDGPAIYQNIKSHGLEQNFICFEQFIPDSTFYSYIRQSDYILPLVHPSLPAYEKYVTDKISGSYNLAIAFRRPMLCPAEMARYEDFKDTSFFYSTMRLFCSSIFHLDNLYKSEVIGGPDI